MVSQQKWRNRYIDEKLNLSQLSSCAQISKITLSFRNVFMNYILCGQEYQQPHTTPPTSHPSLPPPELKDTEGMINFKGFWSKPYNHRHKIHQRHNFIQFIQFILAFSFVGG